MDKWIGKTAIVTGASAGIGAAIVRDLAGAGINVIAMARRLERLQDLQNELEGAKGKVTPIQCDVSSKASIDAAFDEVEKSFGSAQILVNNAGVALNGGVFDDDSSIDDKIASTINTNFLGLVRMTRRAYQLMEKAGDYGIIINIGSILGHSVPYTDAFNINVYSGTKFAVRSITESLRHEIINKGNSKVRICVISPGIVGTELFDAGDWEYHPMKQHIAALKESDVSQTVQFMLMTPYSVNITDIIVKPTGEKF